MGSGRAALIGGLCLGLSLATFWGLGAGLAALAETAPSSCSLDHVDLRARDGAPTIRLNSEVADTADERALGLMHRSKLASSSSMLFVFPQPQSATFWMKDTLIPLDMLFADETGRITHIHQGAVPGDLTPIPGGDGVQFVLEINAGLAAAMQLQVGSVMRHPAISSQKALWPCE